MSVWKTVKNNTMEKNVDMKMLDKALEGIGAKLDYNIKEVRNSWGHEKCTAGIFNVNKNKITALGVRTTKEGGIELVGDTWGSGLGGDGKQDELMNKIAQQYNKELYTVKLNEMGYIVTDTTTNANGEIEITAITY